jgi:tetratricopeptide (TPR) repeat protein
LRFSHESDTPALVRDLGVNYIVTGGVSSSPDRIRVVASLMKAKTGQVLWSEKLEGGLDLAGLLKMERDISGHIAQRLASRYGVIFTEMSKEIRGKPAQSLSAYECVLNFYHYWQRPSPALFGPAHECLERTVRDDPRYAEALSSLALMHIDAYRVGMDRGAIKVKPLPRALELAQRAVDLAPSSVQSRRALYLTYWFMHDIPRALEEAERAIALNPNEPEVVADVGMRFCLNNQWEKGFPLLKQAFDRNPILPDQFRYPFFLRAYLDKRYEDALREAAKIKLPDVIYTHLALAAAYGQLGRKQKAAEALDQVLKLDPAYGANFFADMRKRNIHPEIVHALVDGLRKAGLNVPTT